MRHLSWLAIAAAFLAGGCASPCSDGACNPGGSLFNPPSARYFGTEKLIPESDSCSMGECQPSGYLTFAKYWPALDGWTTKMTARKCAKKELLRRQWELKKFLPVDYRRGYIQAFEDVANGESGDVPALPPPRYWNTAYRSERGRKVIGWWFDGYREGAAAAIVKLNSMRHIPAAYGWTASTHPGEFAESRPIGTCNTTPTPVLTQPVPVRQVPTLTTAAPSRTPQYAIVPRTSTSPPGYPGAVAPNYPPAPVRGPQLPAGQSQLRPVPPSRLPQHLPGTAPSQPMRALPAPPIQSAAPRPYSNHLASPGYTTPNVNNGPAVAPGSPAAASPNNAAADPQGLAPNTPTPGYSRLPGTSPGGGLPSQLSRQQLGPPPGMFNDPPVWRTKPGHSPPPTQ
ncbi:MAG: hypothetical protein ACYTGL_27075 [Planctomycetota bacterium]